MRYLTDEDVYTVLTEVYHQRTDIQHKALREAIDKVPTADAVERKKGKWIDETFKPWGLVHHPYKCDQCGEHSEADSDFCPNCGADMRGENE